MGTTARDEKAGCRDEVNVGLIFSECSEFQRRGGEFRGQGIWGSAGEQIVEIPRI